MFASPVQWCRLVSELGLKEKEWAQEMGLEQARVLEQESAAVSVVEVYFQVGVVE